MRSSISAAAVGLMLAASPAVAQDYQRSAKSGAEELVYASVIYNEGCTGGGGANVRVTAPPANGKAEVRRIQFRMGPNDPCPGVLMKATVIVYRSKGGFRGTDTLRYERTYDRYSNVPGETWTGGTISVQVK